MQNKFYTIKLFKKHGNTFAVFLFFTCKKV